MQKHVRAAAGWLGLVASVVACASGGEADSGPTNASGGNATGGTRSSGGTVPSAGGSEFPLPAGGSDPGGAAGSATAGGSVSGGTSSGGASSGGASSGGTASGGAGTGGGATFTDFGSPCTDSSECDSNVCLELRDGTKACSKPCVKDCGDPAWRCAVVNDVANPNDPTALCVPRFTRLCQPCDVNSECRLAGVGDQAECVPYRDPTDTKVVLGSFCGTPCATPADCLSGYECLAVSGVTGKQCVKQGAVCECEPHWAGRGFTTTCSRAVGAGSCNARRTCTASGLGSCDAATPTNELCNGLDDDCNGVPDDGGSALCNDELVCTDNVCGGRDGCSHPVKTGNCLVGGKCYADGEANPAERCQVCAAGTDPRAWSNAPTTTSCNDGEVCTQGDHCDAGRCVAGSGSAQAEDGYEPNDTSSAAHNFGGINDEAAFPSYTAAGTFDAPTDVDYFRYSIDDICNGFLCTGAKQPKPRAVAPKNVQVCISYTCSSNNQAGLTCVDGSVKATIDGVTACCNTGGVVRVEVDCSGFLQTDDDGTAYVRVAPAAAQCGAYSVQLGTQP